MTAFFRRNKNSDPAPKWTPFSNLSEFEDFIGLVKKYFDRKGLTYTIEEDAVTVTGGDWPYGQMGLSNLAQSCKQSRRPEWKTIISGHFDSMVRSQEYEKAFYAKAHDYSFASPYIGVRIYHNNYISHVGEEVVLTKPIAEDLAAMIVFDLPHSVINLKPVTTLQWNKTNEQLFEIGLANIRMKYPLEVLTEDINGTRIWIIQGDHFFVANSVLDLHLQQVPMSKYGSIVGIPHRHAVLVYPIEDLGFTGALPSFAYVLQGMFGEGPGSISDSLYWYRDGELTSLPYELSEDQFDFKPPEEFIEMMNLLPPEK